MFTARRATASRRGLPDFVILGAQRAATTSLYAWLVEHPSVESAWVKEVHYFDANLGRGEGWYRAHFPIARAGRVSGEATPYYLFHPLVPERFAVTLPQARTIVLLRDPIARAYSHYHHEVRAGRERLSFEDAIAAEPERLAGAEQELRSSGRSLEHQHHSYLARGQYAEQLERWRAFVDPSRMLVLTMEEMAAEPSDTVARVLAFLELRAVELRVGHARNKGEYEGMDTSTLAKLGEHFAPHNRRLYELLGRDLEWG